MKYFFILLILFSISFVSADISYELEWEEEDVVNGRDFEVVVDISDSEDDTLYDGKLWIESKGKIISDRFDEKKESWRSGYYYINDFFAEGVNKISLRIDEEYRDFAGDAFIYFRVRDEDPIGDEIEILSNNIGSSTDDFEEDSVDKEEPRDTIDLQDNRIEDKVEVEPIALGSKVDSVEEKGINSENVVYQSKGLKIIEYSIYGFVVLCVLLCVLVMWRKLD